MKNFVLGVILTVLIAIAIPAVLGQATFINQTAILNRVFDTTNDVFRHGIPAEWGIVGSSTANTAQTVTRAAVAAQFHYVVGYCVTMRGGAVTVGEVELRDGATAVDRIITPAQGGMICHDFPRPVKLTVNTAANLVIPAGGTSVISTGSIQGYTR